MVNSIKQLVSLFNRQALGSKLFWSIMAIYIPIFLLLSLLYLDQFEKALNQRILDQLHSIRSLKSAQLEAFLADQVPENGDVRLAANAYSDAIKNGVNGILLQRDGMGTSGESYLVDDEYKMQSASRFLSDDTLRKMLINTVPVIAAISGKEGSGIHKDYRGVEVFSSYGPFDFRGQQMALMSEIDVEEGIQMLLDMKVKMFWLFGIGVVLLMGSSFLMSKIFTKPFRLLGNYLKAIERQEYGVAIQIPDAGKDVQGIFEVLKSLTNSIQGAIKFAENLQFDHLDTDMHDFGSGAGIALVKMRETLYQEKQKAKILKNEAGRMLQNAEVNERLRISKELHDGIGPRLTILRMKIGQTNIPQEDRTTMLVAIDEIIEDLRSLSSKLVPSSIVDVGLVPTMKNYISGIPNSVVVDFETHEEMDENQISNEIKLTLFRLFQELINNALRHAQCSHIVVRLTIFVDHIALSVADNGLGFDPEAVSKGAGLYNMNERVNLLNGWIEIERSDAWTLINVEIPTI